MADRLSVKLGARSYDVMIGRALLPALAEHVASLDATAVVVITDDNVGHAYGDAVCNAVGARRVTVPAGEDSKSLEVLDRVYAELLGPRDLDRRVVIVALGGGMIGDLAGFAAATLFRGVRWIAVPTSLLAMLDASVGGKTAINRPTGRNLVGAFHQPSAVFCDLDMLATLPQREYVSALGEAVKIAVVGDAELLVRIESHAGAIVQRDLSVLADVVKACVRFKADVVSEDETETSGRRAVLNFGHTLAHALEHLHPGRWLHGEAVAIGICAALRVSVAKAGLAPADAERVTAVLKAAELPVTVPPDVDEGAVIEALLADKKRDGETVRFVLATRIGAAATHALNPDPALVKLLLGRGNG
jgi:3-dehydroquinate synthase